MLAGSAAAPCISRSPCRGIIGPGGEDSQAVATRRMGAAPQELQAALVSLSQNASEANPASFGRSTKV